MSTEPPGGKEGCYFFYIIYIDVNTAIWLVDPTGEKLAILDNLSLYCEVINIFK